MAAKTLKNFLTVSLLGLFVQGNSYAAEPEHFIELVKNPDAGTVRQLCLKDQSLKIGNDVVAVINKASGKVMADKGKGFVTSPVGTFLKEGDRVVALEESGAEVVFFDCCTATLKPNNLISVNATPGCKAAVVDAAAPAAVAGLHPASWIPPAAGVFIVIKGISLE